jgi:hypothetical protein
MANGNNVGDTEPTSRALSLIVLPAAAALTSTSPDVASSMIAADRADDGVTKSANGEVVLRTSGETLRLNSLLQRELR